jgi:intraflagellar transport protein 122
VLRAQVYAYQGRFDEAAKLFNRAGEGRRAMEMFIDLRQFDRAKVGRSPLA